jgi:hypothetical protein
MTKNLTPLAQDRASQTAASLDRLVDQFAVPQPRDLVFYVQLLPFQLGNFQIIRRWMGHCLVNFVFQCLMPSFEFRKMRFDRHMASLRVRQSPYLNQTRPNATPTITDYTPFCARRKSLLCTTPP